MQTQTVFVTPSRLWTVEKMENGRCFVMQPDGIVFPNEENLSEAEATRWAKAYEAANEQAKRDGKRHSVADFLDK